MEAINFNKEQQKAIDSFTSGKSVFVSASAGTGKTTMITHAYLKLLDQGVRPSEIVAITFTNNATNEMFMRIRSLVRSRAYNNQDGDKKKWIDIYNQLSKEANISTIDKFASKLIKKYSYRLDLLPSINIIGDNDEQNTMAIKNIIDSLLKNNPQYKSIYSAMKLYAQYKKNTFIQNITKFIGNIKPSVGSFENLKKQIVSLLQADMTKIDKTLYNNIITSIDFILNYRHDKAAKTLDEAQKLFGEYKNSIIDFKTMEELYRTNTEESISKLREYFEIATIIKSKFKSPQIKNDELKRTGKELKDILLKNYYDIISNLIFIIDNKSYIENLLNFLEEIYNKYEEQKILSNSLTFNDLISKSIDLLKYDDVCSEVRQSIRYLIVDETQDTNHLQYSLVNNLLFGTDEISEQLLDSTDKVAFIVGDRKQSIYRFRNADIDSFLNLEQIFKNGTKSESIYLNENYRSESFLIEFFNSIFELIFNGDEIEYSNADNLISSKPQSDTNIVNIEYLVLTKTLDNDDTSDTTTTDNAAKSDNTSNAHSKSKANIKEEKEDIKPHELEANAIAYHIRKKLDADKSLSYDSFAILLPVFTNLHNYIEALTKYDIPFYISSGKGFFGRIEIAHIIHFLKYLVLKENQLLPLILNKTFFDISEGEIYIINQILLENDLKLKDLFTPNKDEPLEYFNNDFILKAKIISIREIIFELFDYAHFENSSVLINAIISKTKYNAYLMTTSEAEFAYSNIEKFIEIAYSYEREQSGNNIYSFIESLENQNNNEEKFAAVPLLKINAITIMTVHASKGLEFDNVIIGALSSARKANFIYSEFSFIDEYAHMPIHTEDEILELCKVDKDFDKEKQLSERRRLLYVALTRAKKSLILIGEGNSASYRATIENYYKVANNKDLFTSNISANILEHDYSSSNIKNREPNNNTNITIYSYNKNILEQESLSQTKEHTKIKIDDIQITHCENYKSPKKIVLRASSGKQLDETSHKIVLHNIKDLLENKIAEYDEREWYEQDIYNTALDDSENEIERKDLGTMVHEILETFNHTKYKSSSEKEKEEYKEKIIENAKMRLKQYSNKDEAIEKISKAIDKYISNTHIQNILNGSEELLMREHSFEKRSLDEYGNIEITRSKIDLVTHDPKTGIYYIIDYKLSAGNPIYASTYQSQMSSYQEAMVGFLGVSKDDVKTELMYLLS